MKPWFNIFASMNNVKYFRPNIYSENADTNTEIREDFTIVIGALNRRLGRLWPIYDRKVFFNFLFSNKSLPFFVFFHIFLKFNLI